MDLALIGIDALDPGLLEEWRDDLPNLNSLIEAGGYGQMKSSYPPLSIPAWPSLYTGKQGGKHGVYGFTKPEEGSYERRPVNYSDVKAEPLWEAFDAEGFRCGVVNVPLTYPPSDLSNGFVISGWPSPHKADICNDVDVLRDLEADLGTEYDVSPFPLTLEFDDMSDEWLFKEIKDGLWHHQRAFKHLVESHELDVFFGVFMAIDIGSHNFAWNHELLKRLYEEADAALGELLDTLPDDTDVIVMSDHGHGARSRWSFHVNEWLRDEGYLQTESEASSNAFSRIGLTQQNYVRMKNALGIGDVHELLPRRVYEWAQKHVPRGSDSGLDVDVVDWANTAAFSTETMEIFVNDSNKPEGSVDDPDEIRKQLVEELSQVQYPDEDRQLFGSLKTKGELFSGPYYDGAPDIVLIPDEMECNTPTGLNGGAVFADAHWGEHRQDGVLLTAGPSFNDRGTEDARIFDLFPTALSAVDVAIPENVDGRVLEDRFENSSPVRYRTPRDEGFGNVEYTPGESEEVREQLEGLGYLE